MFHWRAMLLAMLLPLSSAVAEDTDALLLCRFDGGTGHGGMDADFARGGAKASSVSGCALVSGKQGQAVRIGAGGEVGRLYYPAEGNIDVRRGTIEFWIKLNWDSTQNTSRLKRVWFDVGGSKSRDRIYVHSRDYKLTFAVCDSAGVTHSVYSTSFPNWTAGDWHHVACTWGLAKKAMTIRVDGRIELDRPSDPDKGNWQLDPSKFEVIRIGSFGVYRTPFDAVMDQLQVSSAVRYVRETESRSREQRIELRRRRNEAEQALAGLAQSMDQVRRTGADVVYYEAIAVAVRTGLWRMKQSARKLSVEETASYCDYIIRRCAEARAELAMIVEGRRRALKVPRPSVLNLRVAGNTFQNEHRESVLLIGIRNILTQEVPIMSRFFNLDTWSWHSPAAIAQGKAHNMCGQVYLFWQNAVQAAVERCPEIRNVGGYSGHNWAKGLCVESPKSRRIIAESIAALPIAQRGEDSAYPYTMLSAEDRYMCYCARSIEMFRDWLKNRYGDRDTLNKVWGTTYGGFGAVSPPRLEHSVLVPNNRAAWYDWLRFNRDRVTEFYAWLKTQVRKAFPLLPVNGGTQIGVIHSRFGVNGIDFEAVNERVNDVIQCETLYHLPIRSPIRGAPPYGLDINGEATLDFQRSTCGKPATDLEFHAWLYYAPYLHRRGETLPRNYTSAAIYRHYLHGIRAANIWVWNRKENSAHYEISFGCSPTIPLECVEECLRAALDVRRLAREIIALSDTQPEVAILFCDSTLLQIHPSFIKSWHKPTPCTVELKNVYHGSLFLDAPIGFVTERTIARGHLSRYRVVLVPAVSHIPPDSFDALMDYVEAGGALVVTPRSFLFDPYNRPRPYLKGIVEVSKTAIYGLLPKPNPASFNNPEFIERQVVNPGDSRIPGMTIRTTGHGVFKGCSRNLEGVGVVQTITAPGAQTLATFADGTPAIVSLIRGKGKIYYCAIPLKPQSYATLLEAVLAETGVERPIRVLDDTGASVWGVEARACEYQGDILMYAINLLSEAVTVHLAGPRPVQAVHDLIADQGLGSRFRLAPLQTVILRVKVGPPEPAR